MTYNLEFVKISNEHEFAGVGFAGNIFIILNALTHIGDDDFMYVDMGKNECACSEKNTTLYDTKNCWEYYFNQTRLIPGENNTTLNSLLPANIGYEDRNIFMYPENFTILKNKFYRNFQLKDHVKEIIDNFYNDKIKDKKTLGVQVRLTDMKHYHNVSPVESYLNKVKEILHINKEIDQIFLSTDDSTVIPIFEKEISVPIVYYTDMFRANNDTPHLHPYDRFKSDRDLHRYKIGLECLQEILTLSKCDYLFKADVSSISIVGVILSENIKQVYKL